MNKNLKFGGIELSGRALLAPLAGVTDAGFRYLAKFYGAALTCTEMVSAKGLLFDNRRTKDLLITAKNEDVSAVQLFGREPDILAEASLHPDLAKFSVIDINMGCPVPKIVNNGEGSALMREPKLAAKIISSVVKKAGRPVTVKFRKGYDETSANAVEFAKMCEDSGAAMIAVHGRTRSQMYSGKADWRIIGEVAAAVKIPVVGNGDIFSKSDADRMTAETGCSGVMVARGALGRPWIFRELSGGEAETEIKNVILAQIRQLAFLGYPERYVTSVMRKHVAWYTKGMHDAAQLRQAVNTTESLPALLNLIEQF